MAPRYRSSPKALPWSIPLGRIRLTRDGLQIGFHTVVDDDRGIAELRMDRRSGQLAIFPLKIDDEPAARAQPADGAALPGGRKRRQQIDLKRAGPGIADVTLQQHLRNTSAGAEVAIDLERPALVEQ